MNEGCSRLDDDGDLVVVAVAQPVERHNGDTSYRPNENPTHPQYQLTPTSVTQQQITNNNRTYNHSSSHSTDNVRPTPPRIGVPSINDQSCTVEMSLKVK